MISRSEYSREYLPTVFSELESVGGGMDELHKNAVGSHFAWLTRTPALLAPSNVE